MTFQYLLSTYLQCTIINPYSYFTQIYTQIFLGQICITNIVNFVHFVNFLIRLYLGLHIYEIYSQGLNLLSHKFISIKEKIHS